MIAVRPKNTKQRGLVEYFGYPEDGRFVGVCLTFNIVEEGKNLSEVMRSVEEAAMLHLQVVRKKKLSDDLLNRYAHKDFWDKYFAYQNRIASRRVRFQNSTVSSVKAIEYTRASQTA